MPFGDAFGYVLIFSLGFLCWVLMLVSQTTHVCDNRFCPHKPRLDE